MIIRRAHERGSSDIGWLQSQHTFSFASYHDPNHMGHESLRVINEDIVAPGAGFQTHPHEDMEIISYVLEGALEHKDSMGNGSVIRVGDVQRMSAGTGVTHSEFNHSKEDPVHFLQIWFLPSKKGLEPSYEQKSFSGEDKQGQLKLVASHAGRDGSVSLNQDMDMYVGILEKTEDSFSHTLSPERRGWVHVARGEVRLNGTTLQAGDGVALLGGEDLNFEKGNQAEVILFDMAPLEV